jgi:hypothetical protein
MSFLVIYFSMSQAFAELSLPYAIVAVLNGVDSILTKPKVSASDPNAHFPLDLPAA